MAAYDRLVPELMEKWKLPGGAVAVAKDGRLVLARGYGLADVERGEPVEPDALFRIASISKPITAATVLVLTERGQLKLDSKALDLLGPVEPPKGQSIDPRWGQVTVRQLLQHTGGFDRRASFDPMFRSREIARDMGVPTPADPAAIVRYMLGRPLDFDPGAHYAYSNFGYCLLGRIVERASGQGYEPAVRSLVLEPAGITRMRLGRTKAADRFPGEVCYYPHPGAKPGRSVFGDDSGKGDGSDLPRTGPTNLRPAPGASHKSDLSPSPVPQPYGTFSVEAMDAHGGWIASAVDLVRFVTALDGVRPPGLLKPETVGRIEAPPSPKIEPDRPATYGLGWALHPAGKGTNWSHTGSLPGTAALVVRTYDGIVWAAVFNSRPAQSDDFLLELDRTLWKAVKEVRRWPEHDLFPRYH